MVAYRFRALDRSGAWRDGEVEAPNAGVAARLLAVDGIIPVRIEAAGHSPTEPARRPLLSFASRRESPATIARALAWMLTSGLSVEEALTAQIETARESGGGDAAMARHLRDSLRRGEKLSAAFRALGAPYDGLFAQMVATGEATGKLGPALHNLSRYLDEAAAFRSAVLSALVYPSVLLATAIASVFFILIVVVPGFEDMLTASKTPAPLSMRILVSASHVAEVMLLAGPLLAVATWLGSREMLRRRKGRRAFARALLGVPFIGSSARKIEAARYARTLAMALQQGVDLLPALRLAAGGVANAEIGAALEETERRVRGGERLGAALKDARLLPPLALRMVSVGEASGKLGPLFLEIASGLKSEIDAETKRFLALLEPALILVMGLTIGGIVVTIFGAISSLNTLTP